MENQKEITLGSLYDFNKQLVLKNSKPMNMKQLKKQNVIYDLEEWFNWQIDGYAILLCRERYDFTVFHLYETENENPPKVATKELIDLIWSRGNLLSIEKDTNDKNVWEIWIEIDGEAFAYYLFNCDDWVIEC